MKMYALYDTETEQYATCLEFPYFVRSKDWTTSSFKARKHSGLSSMKGAVTRLLWRLETNVEMLLAGSWDAGRYHNDIMKTWSIECERRKSLGIAAFGIVIVEVDDSEITPTLVKI